MYLTDKNTRLSSSLAHKLSMQPYIKLAMSLLLEGEKGLADVNCAEVAYHLLAVC